MTIEKSISNSNSNDGSNTAYEHTNHITRRHTYPQTVYTNQDEINHRFQVDISRLANMSNGTSGSNCSVIMDTRDKLCEFYRIMESHGIPRDDTFVAHVMGEAIRRILSKGMSGNCAGNNASTIPIEPSSSMSDQNDDFTTSHNPLSSSSQSQMLQSHTKSLLY